MRKFLKFVAFLVFASVCFAASFAVITYKNLPDTFFVEQGKELRFANMPYLVADTKNQKVAAQVTAQSGNSYNTSIKLLGVIPIKTVRVSLVNEQYVNVCGTPFGIKMFSDGVMVVGFSEIYTNTGYHNPAKTAGLCLGDTIHTMNGISMRTNEDISHIVNQAKDKPILVEYTHKNERKQTTITAVKQTGNDTTGFRLGMWVRDSSAGIGTMTMIDYQKGVFAGLGHSITDIDTGEKISLLSGEIVPVLVSGYSKSSVGSPGELKGVFQSENIGSIVQNNTNGVYGKLLSTAKTEFLGTSMPVAKSQEVLQGTAEIWTTIDGTKKDSYTVEIEKIALNTQNPNQNMVIRITDKRLLDKTGGIIQGMSGSPIIQNGKIIGAVTHVLVSDPTRGFAIFAENMLETMQIVATPNDTALQNIG